MSEPVPIQAVSMGVNADTMGIDAAAISANSTNSRSALISTIAWFRDLMLSVLIAVLVILFL
jgi:hypothetical protein